MMSQDWFEMTNIRKRWLKDSVWIPLRAVQYVEDVGRSGFIGQRQEFYGVGTIAVPTNIKNETEKLGWTDIGINRQHYPETYDNKYIPCDIFEDSYTKVNGIALVLEQSGNSQEPIQWHLHQDIVIALGLKREDNVWVSLEDGYAEVAQILYNQETRPILLQIKNEYLRDYLCARKMALYITSFRSREEVVETSDHILWDGKRKVEGTNLDRWEGHSIEIHEGGMPFGGEAMVFHASRTDVDSEVDVPNLGFPTDKNISSKSWTKKEKGRKLYRVIGELWRNEWIEPGDHSQKIRDDVLPATAFFITDASGTKESRETLSNGSRWLWFKPDVIISLAHRRGGSLGWYTENTGTVGCSPGHGVHFGINKLGFINVYAKDIGLLPDWQQHIWAGFNITPEGGVSEELLDSQMRAQPANTQAPEAFLAESFSYVNKVTINKFGEPLFREPRVQ